MAPEKQTLNPRRRPAAAALAASLAALGLAALWFRCHALGNIPGLNGDEAWYGVTAWNILHGGAWLVKTPAGNPVNPFFFALLLPLEACFRPSITLLRIVPLASGLAALALNWWLCRRVFDRPTAVISTLVLAVLPIDIAYSRFAWDAAQSLPATLLVWYFSLAAVRFPERQDRFTAAAIVALLAAVLVHPTNIFAGAAIAAGLIARWRQFRFQPRRLTVLALATLALICCATYLIRLRGEAGGGVLSHLAQLVHPHGDPHFAVLYANLFSGQTVYQYISGADSWLRWPALGVVVVWGVLAAAAWRLWRDTRAAADRVLAAAWLLELAAFAVLAGPQALWPGQERYAICLVAPAVMLAARGAAVWWGQAGRVRTAAVVLALAAAGFVLADFHQHYFRFIEQTGGRAHRTFRTAAVEPKRAALDYILQHRGPGVTWIVADDYWSCWSLRYLALADHDVRVVQADKEDAPQALALARTEGRAWYVRFCPYAAHAVCGGIVTRRVTDTVRILDYGGRPVLCVSQPSP
ncbi:MAG: ArnT family glycosyltransferase [Thermoguttaceae bacterium]